MLRSVKGKFIVFSVFFIVLTVGVPFSFLIQQIHKNFHQRSTAMLDTTLDMLDYALNNAMMLGFQKNVQHVVDKIALNKKIDRIRIIKSDGKIIFSSDSVETGKNLNKISPAHLNLLLEGKNERKISLLPGNKVYAAMAPILNEKECQPCHGNAKVISYLEVDTELTEAETNFFTGSFHFLFLAGVVVLIMIIGFYIIFHKYINKPLQGFVTALDELEKGNMNVRLPAIKKDEFGLLESHFNKMVSELQSSREQIENMHFEQLQRADRLVTLGELAAEMAHEVNNHAAIILSRSDYLQFESLRNPALQKYHDDFDVINNQITKTAQMTGNILKHSRKLSKDFHEFDLVKLVNESLVIMDPIITKRKIKVIKDFPDEIIMINGNPSQIEQVVTNLVNNALDAMQNGGELTLVISRDDEKILLSVKDNGCGISITDQEQIFNPFFSTKTADKGTGLGLYIVRNILKNHNAEIKCSSKINNGAEFIIIFKRNL